jgi:hypothetical protein
VVLLIHRADESRLVDLTLLVSAEGVADFFHVLLSFKGTTLLSV